MATVYRFHGYPDAPTGHPYPRIDIIPDDDARYFYLRVGINLMPHGKKHGLAKTGCLYLTNVKHSKRQRHGKPSAANRMPLRTSLTVNNLAICHLSPCKTWHIARQEGIFCNAKDALLNYGKAQGGHHAQYDKTG